MPNPVVQFQILSTVPEETAKFYSTLFDWEVDAANPLGYRQINTGSTTGIQGGIWPAPPPAHSFVQLFVAVEDVKAAIRKAEGLGARLLVPATTLPDGGEIAVLSDPLNMSFAVWKAAK